MRKLSAKRQINYDDRKWHECRFRGFGILTKKICVPQKLRSASVFPKTPTSEESGIAENPGSAKLELDMSTCAHGTAQALDRSCHDNRTDGIWTSDGSLEGEALERVGSRSWVEWRG